MYVPVKPQVNICKSCDGCESGSRRGRVMDIGGAAPLGCPGGVKRVQFGC